MRGASVSSARRRAAALVPLALLTSAGCASSGRSFDADKLPRIEEGVTTRQEILDWFGPPLSSSRRTSGFTIYKYLHEEESVRDSGTFSRLAGFIGSFFGMRGAGSPVNVRYRNRVRHELVVLFDPHDVVTEFGYESVEIPSQEIY